MSESAPKAMSVEEYLRTERESPVKREYVGGFVYPLHAQAGASGRHVRLCGRIGGSLLNAADEKRGRLYQCDMQLSIPAGRCYIYPDVMLVCGADQPDDYYETAPCFLAEVISSDTADIDRRHKYSVYTGIPSLQTYLIVSQDSRHVVEYQRGAEGWQMRELKESGEVSVPCLGVTLTLEQIYRNVL